MQNKGFVRLLAAALMLVCLFYLSFSFVTNNYEKKARAFANGDEQKYYNYMDSMAGETVWMGYSLRDCREKEIGLGLDLKGGMNVQLEISVADVLKVLSDYNTNENFNLALENSRIRQAKSGEPFLKVFKEEFEKLDSNGKLAGIFSTYTLKDRISNSATNDEVIEILQEEVDAAIDNSFNVLRSRIDRFGVVQPNIQKLNDMEGRILVELPGVKEPERVRKLLQGSANLEFWETYKFQEIYQFLEQANSIIRDINQATEEANNVENISDSTKNNELLTNTDSIAIDEIDSITENLAENPEENKVETEEDIRRQMPLFAVLHPEQNNGPVVGMALSIDTAEVNQMLQMRQVQEILPRELKFAWTVKSIDPDAKQQVFQLIALKVKDMDGRAPLEGDVITDARADFGQYSNGSTVSMKMNSEGAKIWARLTKENIGREIAIVLDGYVYSFPTVNTEISGGSSEITGNFTPEEAKDLANVLKSGKMPAPAHIIQEDVVGPSLGEEAIHAGLISFIIAFALVLLYMIFYYGIIPGLIADTMLLINILFLFGILASFKAVLTLPGIAGIIFTMGTAVDANVLIYERIREELRGGKNFKNAVTDGYSNAFSAIADANITTLITGIILAYFGTGPIKGFATTLIIGIITSFFTAVFLSRLIYDRLSNRKKEMHLQFTTPITKNWFQNLHFNFIKARKFGYIFSAVILIAAAISLGFRSMKRGIDFSGGRNFVVRFEEPVNADEIRSTLSSVFEGSQTSVITMGDENQVRISTNYKIDSPEQSMDSTIENMLFKGLDKWINDDVTEDMFVSRYVVKDNERVYAQHDDTEINFGIQSSQKVGPTVADDIKTSAVWSVALALLAIGLYILIRFRNISFSVGAVLGLCHDVLFILGIYSIFYSIMPFSLEVDQSFIAAILTVIGYSINDTVVIFDRIRENIHLYPKRQLNDLINSSINSTLSRTFSTSLSTALPLLAMFIFGGETIRGFVFAILIGVIVGTYSTIFISSPIAYDIQNAHAKRVAKKKLTK